MAQSSKWSSLLFCAVLFQLQLTLSQGEFSCQIDSPVTPNVLSTPVGPLQVSVDLTHTFCGDIRGTIASGFHARPAYQDPVCATVHAQASNWIKLASSDKDYSAVQYPAIYDSSIGAWVYKNGISSFFPAILSYDTIIGLITDMVNNCTA